MEKNGYYIGLDMGTASVGWAVTDHQYNLIRKKGKDCWGIRIFDEALTAVDKRAHRITRRGNQREKIRRGLVRIYFDDEVSKVDPTFFIRLDNSKYYLEDKAEGIYVKNILFNDKDYTDKDYFNQYPTVFHLRKELINSKEPHDVRLVYLAITNMFKHRGHFLNENLSASDNMRDIQTIYDEFATRLCQIDETIFFPCVDATKLLERISDKSISRSTKVEQLTELFGFDKKQKREIEFVKCICGLKVDSGKLFKNLESEDKTEICFKDFSYEDKIPEIINSVGDENYQVIELMKEIFDTGILSSIMKDYHYLSEARVDEYEKHRKDLETLKRVIKRYKSEADYDLMFRSSENGTYGAYVNSVNSDIKTRRDMGGNSARNEETLYKRIREMLKGIEDQDVSCILREIENETFLPKQLTSKNGTIPNQIHRLELQTILDNAESYLPFLKERDASGLSVSERIIKLFEFHIPYYVGPVSTNSKTGWVVRKEGGQVLPWNMEEKIDMRETSEKFIKRMVKECTYLRGEKVLPQASLIYESYCVLNEINNIRIDGMRIPNDLKKKIYVDLFQNSKKGKPTRKQIESYLIGLSVMDDGTQLTGIDNTINNALSSYVKFKAIFGCEIEMDTCRKMIERIIFWGTVYGDSKKMLKDALLSEFGGAISPEQIKRVLTFRFNGWGRFSKNFLEMKACDKETGEKISLLNVLWNTNQNLEEILNCERYTFKEELEARKEERLKRLSDFCIEDLNAFYFSPPVKRMVWQTMSIVKEIVEVMGSEPDSIYLEMTRNDQKKGDKGRKASRKNQLLELYKSIDDDMYSWNELIENADSSGKLRSKKMYLFIKQMGRDIYTGKQIELEKLFDDNLYDIDHIYPRNFVKDDNLENNLVLVDKTLNNRKQNYYPIDQSIFSNPEVRELWKMLRNNKLMNEEKYKRLTCREELNDEQKARFIARQLVETSQATKGIADILKIICPSTTVVYSKAGNVSDFRHKYELLKARCVNDFHHAKDAYLNIVVGNAYYVKFTQNPYNFIKNEYAKDSEKYNYHLGKMFERDITRNGSVAWIAEKNGKPGTISTVKRVMSRNTPLLTRKNFEGHGKLFDLTIRGKNKAKFENYVPIKTSDSRLSDVKKYGGYTSLNPAYFIFIEYKSGKKMKKAFDVVPILFSSRIKSESDLVAFCEDILHYQKVRIICPMIKKYSLLRLDGYSVYIAGMDSRKNVELQNAVGMCVSPEMNNYIHNLEKSLDGHMRDDVDSENNIKLYDMLIEKHSKGVFRKSPKSIGETLISCRNKFIELGNTSQVDILNRLLSISAVGASSISLKEIGGPSSDVGRMRISSNMTDRSELLLINTSITGLHEQRINLLEI